MFNFDPKTFEQKEEISKSHPHIRIYYDSTNSSSIIKKHRCSEFNKVLTVFQECAYRFNLDHPSLIPIQGCHFDDYGDEEDINIYTKMPFIGIGSNLEKLIDDHIHMNMPIPGGEIIKIMYNLARGLDYLHSKRIVYQNLKPSNVILDDKGSPKLSDLSLSMLVPEEEEFKPILLEQQNLEDYHAPEVHENIQELTRNDLFKTDVWSLGAVISELCLLETKIMSKFLKSKDKFIIQDILTRIETKYSPNLVKILRNMLSIEISQRGTIKEILKQIEENFGSLLDIRIEINHQERPVNEIDHLTKKEQSLDLIQEKADKSMNSKEEKQFEALEFHQVIESLQENCKELQISQITGKILSIKPQPHLAEKVHDHDLETTIDALQVRMQAFHVQAPSGFDLNLCDCENITDKSLISVASGLAKCLDSITSLKIDLLRCSQITNTGINELTLVMSENLQNLQELNLSFYECKALTDEGTKQIENNLSKNLDKLKKLSLNFNWCNQITDEGISHLVKSLCKKHVNLSSLELYLSKCRSLTSRGFSDIGLQIGHHLVNLTHLYFDFSMCESISDDTILNLGSSILFKLKNLQEFHLDLTRCVQISNQGLQNLYTRINRAHLNLKVLNLNFTKCEKITDDGISNLMIHLSPKLHELKHLNLNFHSCSNLTESSLSSISSSLSNDLKSLEIITLGFYRCFKLNDNGLEYLCRALKKMSRLTQAHIDFRECPKISKNKWNEKMFFSSKIKGTLNL